MAKGVGWKQISVNNPRISLCLFLIAPIGERIRLLQNSLDDEVNKKTMSRARSCFSKILECLPRPAVLILRQHN